MNLIEQRKQRELDYNIKLLSEGGLFHNDYTIVDGIVRWNSSNNVPPSDMVEAMIAYGHDDIDIDACHKAREADNAVAIAQYIEARNNMTEDEKREEAFERRAAFGPGVEVVNVITGERSVS